MRFTVERNWIEMIGPIWWPVGAVCAMRRDLSAYDLHNIEEQGEATLRENVECWLSMNAGDFQHVKDFRAVIGEEVIPWQDAESELTYADCIYPAEA